MRRRLFWALAFSAPETVQRAPRRWAEESMHYGASHLRCDAPRCSLSGGLVEESCMVRDEFVQFAGRKRDEELIPVLLVGRFEAQGYLSVECLVNRRAGRRQGPGSLAEQA